MFILAVKGFEEDGAFSLENDDGDKVLLMFEEEDDAERYVMMLEEQDYPEMNILEVEDRLMIKTCDEFYPLKVLQKVKWYRIFQKKFL